ncbi:PASTA domain-containing protein [Blattabacterium cuenoti]|uniref:PASTA domain-containing protein n=1 Tax=Blattabacterium cuenoti TaxID=1653831 RepID=UPI00163C4A2D|nr:PASTA domain-containing protein [Blattabacterium cuenoti]
MNYSKYILIFIINLLAAIYLLYKVTQLALKWVDVYTKHGSYVEIPNLRYLTLSKSISILNRLGLKYDIDKSYYDPYLENNKIISFFPGAGSHVKQGRFIYIKINIKPNKYCNILPDIMNKNKDIAIKLLHKNNIIIKEIRYIDDINKDKIIKIFYNNKPITYGYIFCPKNNLDGITLIIGKSIQKNNFIIPNVIGMSLKTAISTLKNKFFNIINFYYDYPNSNESAKVYRQSPSPGKTHNKNQTIDLWLSNFYSTKKEIETDSTKKEIETDSTKKEIEKDSTKKEIETDSTKKEIETDSTKKEIETDSTKKEVKKGATKKEEKKEATKEAVKKDDTKKEVKKDATKKEVKKDATKKEMKKDATKKEMKKDATKKEMKKDDTKKEMKKDATKKEMKKNFFNSLNK